MEKRGFGRMVFQFICELILFWSVINWLNSDVHVLFGLIMLAVIVLYVLSEISVFSNLESSGLEMRLLLGMS